jgi:hypothetical protein
MITKIKPANMKIYKVFYFNNSKNANFRLAKTQYDKNAK